MNAHIKRQGTVLRGPVVSTTDGNTVTGGMRLTLHSNVTTNPIFGTVTSPIGASFPNPAAPIFANPASPVFANPVGINTGFALPTGLTSPVSVTTGVFGTQVVPITAGGAGVFFSTGPTIGSGLMVGFGGFI
jgi:hypothetical protein